MIATCLFERESLAPRWHTAALIGLILAVASAGTLLGDRGGASPTAVSPTSRVTAIYLPMLVVQWGLVLYVCRIGRTHSALSSLLGRRWDTPQRALTDIALAVVGWSLILAFELACAKLARTGPSASVAAMLPQTPLDRAAWIAVAASAGFCEEVVYRGYLQTQLAAFTGSVPIAIVIQAVLFGIAHGEQGVTAMVRLTIYGLMFGALARWRRSLWPGIACHAWTDIASGLLRG